MKQFNNYEEMLAWDIATEGLVTKTFFDYKNLIIMFY